MFLTNHASEKEINGGREPGIIQAFHMFAILGSSSTGQREGLLLMCEVRWAGTWQDRQRVRGCPHLLKCSVLTQERGATRWDYSFILMTLLKFQTKHLLQPLEH